MALRGTFKRVPRKGLRLSIDKLFLKQTWRIQHLTDRGARLFIDFIDYSIDQ